MKQCIAIRREDKNKWERRTPLIPRHVAELHHSHSIDVIVQSSPIRTFTNSEYQTMGGRVVEDISDAQVVFGIKEIPSSLFLPNKTYVFFSHTIKAQPYNMPMLKRMLELGCTLIDYERVVDEKGRRLIFFGRYAGIAGMIDTLHAFGKRLVWEGTPNPFQQIKPAYLYHDLSEAKESISVVGEIIKKEGLPLHLMPLICGFTGYGNVSLGAQEIFDLLPVKELHPSELITPHSHLLNNTKTLYKVVFKEEHMVKPIDPASSFELKDYYHHPEKYQSQFEPYIPHLTLLINGIYWNTQYPRLVTIPYLQYLFSQSSKPRLRVIGDISCDINGAIEATVKATHPDNPSFVFDPHTQKINDGCEGAGVVIMAVDNLPCELPRDASEFFSTVLLPYVPEIAQGQYDKSFDACGLSPTIKRAVIAYQGHLTPDYAYIAKSL